MLALWAGFRDCEQVRILLRLSCFFLLFGMVPVGARERVWNQDKAKEKVAEMLKVEASRKQPWNAIPWHSDPKAALAEARRLKRPLLVFMFSQEKGPPLELCCLPGRLIRGIALSDADVQRKVKSSFVPLKLVYTEGSGFPVKWSVLKGWETKFDYSSDLGSAGCAVINSDLNMEFANSGSAMMGELFDSVAYDARKFSRMLSRGYQRWKEDGIIGREGGLSIEDRKQEVDRYRRGVAYEVEKEGQMRFAPKGYSLEKALELFRLAGVDRG